jgi:quinol monooxygenase YgiN
LIIYAGTVSVDPADRDRYVALRTEQIERARAKPGVENYVIAADPIDPGIVQVFECYRDEAALAAHEKTHVRNADVQVLGMEIFRYEVASRSELVL